MLKSYKKEAVSGSIKQAIIFIHGYGANGQDLLSLAPYFQKNNADLLAVAPDAPNKLELSGDNSYYWFDLKEFSDTYLDEQLQKALPILDEFIQKVKTDYSLGNKDIILCGFSQGTLLSTHYALTKEEAFKAVIAFSGGILPSVELKITNQTPIYLIHGEDDDVLPANYSIDAANLLQEANHPHKLKLIANLAHSINGEGISFALDSIN